MSAFARAAASLAADPNLGEPVTYLPPGGGAGIPCRAIRYQRDPLADLGQHHVRQTGFVFSLRIAEVPTPAKGAQLSVGGKTFAIFDVQPDEDMLTHRVSVR